MCAQTGRLQLRQRCVATRTERLLTTTIRRSALHAQLAVATAMRRYADERLRDSNASLRAGKMFYFCYADGAVATAMRRYIHVNVIFLLTTKYYYTRPSVACVSFVYLYLCVRELGDCSYDSDACATRTERLLTTAIRRYALRMHKTHKIKMFYSISTSTSHAPKRHSAGWGDERGGTCCARQGRLFTINARRRL